MSELFVILTSIGLLVGMTGFFGILLLAAVYRFAADVPQGATRGRVPAAAITIVALWLALSLVGRMLRMDAAPQELTLPGVQWSCLISFGLAGLLLLSITDGKRQSARNHGLYLSPFARQLSLGAFGYLAAIGPTGLLLMASSLWRTVDTQHAYLQALRGDSGQEMLAWIIVSAVIAAPVTEELLFRVTLQGWLSERLSGLEAVCLTALVFALVHGWRDALPLIPLSLILGGIFHRTRSYWSCVATHALFNGTNIALALLTNPASKVE